MKKAFNFPILFTFIALLTNLLILPINQAFAQSCNQVEILYQDLDCSDKSPHPDGSNEGKGCKTVSACKNQSYPYSAAGSWASYNWTATGPAAVTIAPGSNVPNINIAWPLSGTYTLTLTVTDGSGNTFTTCLTVNVKDKPLANFTFSPNNVCAGSTISFTDGSTFSGGMVYSWNFGDPLSGPANFSSSANPTHTFTTFGNYPVTLVVSSFTTVTVPGGANGQENIVIKTCCSDTITKIVTIVAGTISIECISTVCAGDTATYTAVGCANPTWYAPTGGTILSQSGNQVTIIWGNGMLQGVIMAQCPGGCLASVPVPIIPQNPMPSGNMNPCTTSTTSYTLPVLPGTFYTWHLNDLTPTNYDYLLTTFPDNNTVWINWSLIPPGTYHLSINLDNKHLCCSSYGVVTIISKGTFSAYNDQTVCTGNQANLWVSPAAGTFAWSVSPATGVVPPTGSGSAFTPVFNTPGNYIVTVNETNNTYCNTTQLVKIKVILTPVPGTITGPAVVCPGSQYTYSMSTPAPSGFYYSWMISSGAGTFQPGSLLTTTGNSVGIAWTSIPASISVSLQPIAPPPCPSPAVTLSISQAVTGSLSGTVNVCVDDSLVYTLSGGNLPASENVQWTITPPSIGTVIAGQGTNSPKILWHGQVLGAGPWTATITASSNCGSTTLTINISKKPFFTLSQTGNICLPGGVTLTATGSAPYTYTWSNSATGASTNVSAAGFYTATATNGSCSFSRFIEVKDPFAIRPISCGVGYCSGSNTNEQIGVEVWKPGSGTFTYEWYSGIFNTGTLLTTTTNTSLNNFYTATLPGDYYVIVKYGSCQKYVSFTVKKVCCPDVNLPAITNVTQISCNDYSFTGTASNPGGAPITWSFGDGSTQTGTSGVPVTHHYIHAFDYCVTFCVGAPVPNPTACTGNCATARALVPIEALFTYSLGCNGCVSISDLSVVLASPSQISYLWDFGDGFTSTSLVPPTHCYTTGGNYNISLTITYNNGIIAPCSSTYTQNAVYVPLAIAMASPVCTGQLNSLSSNPGGFVSYAWNFGDSLSSYIPNTSHAFSTSGPKLITLTVTDLSGNTCVANNSVTVLPGISNCTLLPGYICPGGSAILTAATGAGYTYLWQQYTGSVYVAPVPNSVTNLLSVTVPGFYHVIITNANGCTCVSNLVEVKTATKPKALISVAPSTIICASGSVMLTSVNAVPGFTSEWYANGYFGSLLYTGNTYYNPAVSATTNFSLVLTNQYGCKDTCTMTIYVYPTPAQPVIVSNPAGTLCEGIPILLTVTNYSGNITWSTGTSGLSITVTSAGIYTATYTDPVSGCTSKKNILVNRRPVVDLFPHLCDSIPCECVRPFSIYAPLPLTGPAATTYNIQWYNPALSGSGPVLNNVTTGSYYIVVTDPSTGCATTSNSYSVVVPPCDTCNCKGSSWEFISLTAATNLPAAKVKSIPVNPVVTKLACKGIYELKCNQPYTVNAGFNCADKTCTPKVSWLLTLPDNTTQSGNAPATFTPIQSGTYSLMLYGWCGNSKCDSCLITFKVDCQPVGCDCKNSHWGDISLSTGAVKKIIKCGTPSKLKCLVPFTVNGSFICADPVCTGTVTYTLTPPVGPPITGTLPLTYTPTASGVYVLELTGMCGNTICDKCIFDFTVECPPVIEDCCPHEKDLIIKGLSSSLTQQSLGGNNYSLYTANISIAGGSSLYQQVKATIIDFQLIANFEECMACKNNPFTWSSISAANLAGISPVTTGATPTTGFNVPANPTENPREIVWESGSPINLSTPQPTTINLYLPAASALPCCELSAKVCIKFSFIDTNCKLCEKIYCTTLKINKEQGTDKMDAAHEELFK